MTAGGHGSYLSIKLLDFLEGPMSHHCTKYNTVLENEDQSRYNKVHFLDKKMIGFVTGILIG